MGCTPSKMRLKTKVSPEAQLTFHSSMMNPVAATGADPAAQQINTATLLMFTQQLQAQSLLLAQTGNRDALGGTWKTIQFLRSQVGSQALSSISQFLVLT